jgi:predicted nicotinamide N-methyase
VLELGAGMGVAGLVAAQLTGAPVLLTDGHQTIVRLLEINRDLNAPHCALPRLPSSIGTARQKMVLERWTNPMDKRSRRTCSLVTAENR